MSDQSLSKKVYDFATKDPKEPFTKDELENFEEGMRLRNSSSPAENVDMKKAVQSVIEDMDKLYP